jgi:DNA transposition AAA+ family ATPase
MASKLIVMKGLPASGKTTWSKAYVKSHPNTVRINRDDLRLMLYNVRFAIDDRDRVVDAWRDLGLVCLQCAPGDF